MFFGVCFFGELFFKDLQYFFCKILRTQSCKMLILEIEDVFGLMRHFKMIWRCLGYVFQGIFSERSLLLTVGTGLTSFDQGWHDLFRAQRK